MSAAKAPTDQPAAQAMRLRLDAWELRATTPTWTADLYSEDVTRLDEGLPVWQGGYHPTREAAEAEARAWAAGHGHRVVC